MRSFFIVLVMKLKTNLSFSSDKITSGTNVSRELEEYKKEKKYNKNIVDLVIYALANCTQMTVLIYYVYDGVVKTHEIPPTREAEVPNGRVTLARIGEHYEPVLSTDTFQRICDNTITINDSPLKRGNKCSENVLLDSECTPSKGWILDSDSSDSSPSIVSSADSSSSDSSSNDSLRKSCHQKKNTPKKLTPDVQVIKCASLPPDIDDTTAYELPFDSCNRMQSSIDGRKWKRYISSKRPLCRILQM